MKPIEYYDPDKKPFIAVHKRAVVFVPNRGVWRSTSEVIRLGPWGEFETRIGDIYRPTRTLGEA